MYVSFILTNNESQSWLTAGHSSSYTSQNYEQLKMEVRVVPKKSCHLENISSNCLLGPVKENVDQSEV